MAPVRRIGDETLLDFPSDVGMISYTFRWDVLSPSLDVIGFLDVTGRPSIRCSPAANITRQCSGVETFTSDLAAINLYRVRIRPMMVLEDGTEESLGVFLPQTSNDTTTGGRETTTLTLFDQDAVLDEDMQNSFGVPANGSLTDAMIELLGRADIADYSIVPGGRAADPILWPAGTSRKEILNQLAVMKGCLPPYFDRDGRYVCKLPPDLTSGGFDHLYSFENSRILRDTIAKSTNLEVPNVHTVINSGPTNQSIVGSAKVDRALPFSVENRGRKVVKTWKMQGVESTADAVAIAKMKAATAGVGYAEVTFSTHVDPRHDVWDRVMFGDEVYLETGWSTAVGLGAKMSHSVSRGIAVEES